ncbi:MAG: hypothetical protein QG660_464, partial [Pseudomonadota bacterium]|nr:hypothetical protein [Pseudomonadota bacterium]
MKNVLDLTTQQRD